MIPGMFINFFMALFLTEQALAEDGFCGPYHIGLLENISSSLASFKQFSWTQNQYRNEELQKIRRELDEDIKGLTKEILKSNEDLRKERFTQHEQMMTVFQQILGNLEIMKKESELSKALDCSALFNAGKTSNGIYRIKPNGWTQGFDVFCDMANDGGGWTVIQRRGNFGTPLDFFNKTWNEYKFGFGKVDEEFWLGNDRIAAMSSKSSYELRIDITDYENKQYYATYKTFRVEDEANQFKMQVGNFAGNTDDVFSHTNGLVFSTPDRDVTELKCAKKFHCGWWYKACYLANLNGRIGQEAREVKSYNWYNFGTPIYISYAQMKIRPTTL